MSKRIALSVLVLVVAVMLMANLKSAKVIARSEGAPAGIAVVSVPDVLQKSNRAKEIQESILEKRDQALAELEKSEAALQVIAADIKARKPGTEDFLKLKREFMEKEAALKAQKDFLQQELMMKNQAAMEQVYQEVLQAVSKVAKEEGYELVLDKDKLEFPSTSASELSLTIQTHKVLYHAEYMDITEKVLKELD